MRKLCRLLFTFTLLTAQLSGICCAATPSVAQAERIIFLMDTSGSMQQQDAQREMMDAAVLAASLAPNTAELAFLGVNTQITFETDFVVYDNADARVSLQNALQEIAYDGNTNLVAGLQYAAEKLDGSGHIILCADISEGGLIPRADTNVWTVAAQQLIETCKTRNITIDLLLLGEPPQNSRLAQTILDLSAQTNGCTFFVENGANMANGIEKWCFSTFPYCVDHIEIPVGEGWDSFYDLTLPTAGIGRVRIYIPQQYGVNDFHATYAGVSLQAESGTGWKLIDFRQPAQNGIRLVLSPDITDSVDIALIYDYELDTVISLERLEKHEFQLTLDIVSSKDSTSILKTSDRSYFNATFSVISPTGEVIPTEATLLPDQTYQLPFHSDEIGLFSLLGTLHGENYEIPVSSLEFEVFAPETQTSAVWIPLAILCILGLLAFVIWGLRKQKANAELSLIPKLENDFCLTGRLDFYVTATSEDEDIPPFSYYFQSKPSSGERSLAQMIQACGVRYEFSGSEHISFSAGPDKSLLVQSKGAGALLLRSMLVQGKAESRVAFGEKLYFTATDGKSELAIYYRNTKNQGHSLVRNGAAVAR